jgi:deoxyribodipyrimidine photo-lyase
MSRDENIKKYCLKNNIKCYVKEDFLLHNILNNETLNPNNNKPYLVYTAFYNHLINKLKVSNVEPFNKFIFHKNDELKKIKYKFHDLHKLYIDNPNINVHGGRTNALKILKNIDDFKNYIKERDTLTYQTTQLSAYINTNVVSIREVYYAVANKFNKHHGIIRELIFRDFYYNALYRFPYITKTNFYPKYDNIKWDNDKKLFKLWCDGKTGYPIVDAGMKQLNTIGYMHNRMRMVVASFLIKNLLIDWRWGEKYFATKLIDYNISANNGGWSNISGSGISAQAWYRVFNPSRQNKMYDPNCEYIKKWIPELKDVLPKDIINNNLDGKYYKQCINFEDSRDRYLKVMKTALK